jgi:deoxyadenosine/deoxycytidine kinase
MPRATPKPELEPKPMDIQEMAAEQERAAERERAAEHDEQPEEEEEYGETITLIASDFYALQDTLKDIRFQITDIQRDARQDRLKTQDMLRAILDRLPPVQ